MSKPRNKSSNLNIALQISYLLGVTFFLVFVAVQVWTVLSDYNNFVKAETDKKLQHLRGVTAALASNINGQAYFQLQGDAPLKDDIQTFDQEQTYQDIYYALNNAKKLNELEEELYTLISEQKSDGYLNSYGVSSKYAPIWRHPYDSPLILGNIKSGETFGPYTRGERQWLMALAPINDTTNQANRTVGFVVATDSYEPILAAAGEYSTDLILTRTLSSGGVFLLLLAFILVLRYYINREQVRALANSTRLNNTYKIIEEFVDNVKRGDYKTELDLAEYKDDNLARSLNVLHRKLADNAQNASDRSWIAEGRYQIASILRLHNDFEKMPLEVIMAITKYVNAIQGAFYFVEEDEAGEVIIRMKAKYAYNRVKYQLSEFRVGQGLVGQCAFEKASIHRTEIPEEYVSISSGILGDKKPESLLLVPLITNEKLYGIVELASIHKFDPLEIQLVEELSDIIARTIFNIKTNNRTLQLLHESQEKSTVLEKQQQELQQNEQKLHSLLENSSEIITIYDQDATVMYESPSVTNILGYSPEELLGKRDIDKVHEDGQKIMQDMFETLKKHPEQTPMIEFSYQRKDGSWVWMEAIGKNLISEPAVNGIVVNSRDITERRKAEREQIMRGKMQALSENSPDAILRFDLEGHFLYTNPMLEVFTGLGKDNFKEGTFHQLGLPETITEGWQSILNTINESNELVSLEMDFPTSSGDKIMQVNAIPEMDADEKLETVLVVMHDITERKQQEIIIQQTNKKITDSINYAKRIQNSIIPDNFIIRNFFPNSFIFYKPKDVVSGDFPWFFQRGDDLYFAAVDCTGHGVPGAMMSLIGYFLLNEITGQPEAYDPATILNKLHEGVRKTLRQDQEGAQARDGMDVGLAKINLKKMTVEYAGAHRPLYFVRDGELVQYKGTRKAIGGTHSKRDKDFENHLIEVQPDDSIYYFSDGLPDQFGGPRNLKYGPKRIRETVAENHNLDMQQMLELFSQDFEDWKGEKKQMDDVLLIGIKF